jgi:hypothetical protein
MVTVSEVVSDNVSVQLHIEFGEVLPLFSAPQASQTRIFLTSSVETSEVFSQKVRDPMTDPSSKLNCLNLRPLRVLGVNVFGGDKFCHKSGVYSRLAYLCL